MKKKKDKKRPDRELLLNAVTQLYIKHWEVACSQNPEAVSKYIVYELMTDFSKLTEKELLTDYKKLSGKEYTI